QPRFLWERLSSRDSCGSGCPAAIFRASRRPAATAATRTPRRRRRSRLDSRSYPGGSGRGARGLVLLEVDDAVLHGHADRVARPEVALQDPLRERIFQLLLNRPLQRPSAVDRIVAGLREVLARRIVEGERDVALAEPPPQVLELDVDDAPQMRALERAEHDDVVDPVDELRPEVLADDGHHLGLHPRV